MNKKVLVIVNIALLVVAAVLVCLILGVGQKNKLPSWQEQYDLGIRYYSEGDYDAAILAFRVAIDLDPARPEAYQGAAQAYIALGDEEAAAEILEEGYENTGDETMKEWVEWYEQTHAETALEAVTVSDAYTDRVSGDYYGEYTCCYHIPQVQAEGTDTALFNERIYQDLYTKLEEAVYANQGRADYVPDIQKLYYGWGQKGNIGTILAATDYFHYPWPEYVIYGVDLSTGAEVGQTEILAAYGMRQEDFYAKAEEVLTTYMDNRIRQMEGNPADILEDIRSRTLDPENIRSSLPYIGENGNLCMVTVTWTPAGAGNYYTIIDLTTAADAKEPECTGHGQEPEDVSLYGDVLAEAIAATNNCGEYYNGYGTLYDLDGNGTQELVFHYIKKVSNDYGSEPYEHSFAAVYTIHNGEVVQLVDEKLVGLVAGPSSSISIVEKDGKTYALTTWETGGTDGSSGCERYGEYRLYALDGNEITVDTFAEYFWVYGNNYDVNYSNSYAVIDGTRTGYDELERWAASFREIARFQDFYWDEEAPMTLEEIQNQIRG